ncbi:MAG TPA: Lrp/AsnC family transcriptional regulator [Dehalococcoidia bacterium]|nr:Lrp/AsnC family transcriptional regulator [Dehalococcoidia bacterium]
MTVTGVPAGISDPVNKAILAVSEDRLQGFQPDPFGEIAERCGLPVALVIERVRAMLEAGTIRRVRQTLLSTNIAEGALVAWRVEPARLDGAFDFMFRDDPFSGHVVVRSTDAATAGSAYRLWTTVKVPQGFSLARHCAYLARRAGAEAYRIMPARCLFALGVGHVRRRGMQPGARAAEPADILPVARVRLSELEWRVLGALKREFEPGELRRDLWQARAAEAGLPVSAFVEVARSLEGRKLIGRFSTFLEHVKEHADGERVTRYNALFHWAVPPGREIDAGREVGRHLIVTHAYWREAGPEFGNVNIMAVVHGVDKAEVLAHKAAIDAHLRAAGIEAAYSNVFWGGRSEIKPSEIMPSAYAEWCRREGIDPDEMREEAPEDDADRTS